MGFLLANFHNAMRKRRGCKRYKYVILEKNVPKSFHITKNPKIAIFRG
jgi:hypothetical protein